jgi:hypothetical protein
VEVPVEYIVENRYPVERIVEVEVSYERVVERFRDNPVQNLIDNPVYIDNIIQRQYEQIVEVSFLKFKLNKS